MGTCHIPHGIASVRWEYEDVEEFRSLVTRLSMIVQMMSFHLLSQDPDRCSIEGKNILNVVSEMVERGFVKGE